MSLLCCNCGRIIHTASMYWCIRCWVSWEDDIRDKAPWTKYLERLEQRRRRRERKQWERGYSEEFIRDGDVAVVNGKNKIIRYPKSEE